MDVKSTQRKELNESSINHSYLSMSQIIRTQNLHDDQNACHGAGVKQDIFSTILPTVSPLLEFQKNHTFLLRRRLPLVPIWDTDFE